MANPASHLPTLKAPLEQIARDIGHELIKNKSGLQVYKFKAPGPVDKNGEKFEGTFANNQFNGHGKFTWKTGTYYEGDYSNHNIHGKGKKVLADGTVYTGDFEDKKYCG